MRKENNCNNVNKDITDGRERKIEREHWIPMKLKHVQGSYIHSFPWYIDVLPHITTCHLNRWWYPLCKTASHIHNQIVKICLLKKRKATLLLTCRKKKIQVNSTTMTWCFIPIDKCCPWSVLEYDNTSREVSFSVFLHLIKSQNQITFQRKHILLVQIYVT